jgi:xylulokinase
MAKYLLGIDLGTSSVRAGIFSEDGQTKAIAAESYPIITPSPSIAEQDPIVWWNKTCSAIKKALELSKLKGSDIAGISFSGQMHGTVILDADGNLIAPAVIWADSRSAGVINEIEDIIGSEKINSQLFNRLFPGTQAATLFWFQKNDYSTWRQIRRILLPKDYIRYRMCGLYNTEPSDASSSLLFDVNRREWSEEILKALSIPIEFMPYVVNSDEAVSVTDGITESTGLPDGIPVVLGGSDQAVAALGNGILDENTMFAAIGTGGQIVTPLNVPKASPDLSLNTWCHLPESRWFIEGATLAGGLCLRWFKENFCPETSFEDLTNEAALVSPGADGLIFTPYLNGKRSPDMNPNAAGNFSNIRLMHSKAHFVRAIMEGVVFELKESFDVMKKMGVNPSQIIASGGFTNSPVWMQIMADSFGQSLSISAVDEQSCFGAALIAGIGAGIYKSYWEAAEIIPKPEKFVEPVSENFDIYSEKFDMYIRTYENQFK